MRPIQPVLIIIFCVGAFLYFRFGRTRTLDRLIMVVLVFTGIIMILYPDLTTEIANLIGVGRGTDLLLYFGLSMTGFALIFLYSKLRSVEARLTEVVRQAAIQEAVTRRSPEDSVEVSRPSPPE